jgi:hypothetical protein
MKLALLITAVLTVRAKKLIGRMDSEPFIAF